jgi:plasmid stabilization system protein ParE
MKYRVWIETRAIRDLDEASAWIAAQSSEAAERWFVAIEAEIRSLERFPERCPRAREDGLSPTSCGSSFMGGGTAATGSSSRFARETCIFFTCVTAPGRR